ncbi:MAG TPA: DUF433 domain-containing protein [Planctomycetia bacterium]|jgi:uncharacterized protein (DUF433 family)|nr:DUF433 domain-containing protein [Planctomycetia bacterium]
MMKLPLDAEAPPLREDGHGGYRVGDTRLLFDLVLEAFNDGATPEGIAQDYPSLELTHAYALIAYYLRHKEAVDAYLAERERQAEELRRGPNAIELDVNLMRERMRRARRGA